MLDSRKPLGEQRTAGGREQGETVIMGGRRASSSWAHGGEVNGESAGTVREQ